MRSVLLAVIASLVGFAVGAGKPSRVHSDYDLVPVVVVARDVAAGATVQLDDLSQRSVPEQYVVSDTVRPEAATAVVGQRVTRALKAGDPLTGRDLRPHVATAVARRARAAAIDVEVGDVVHPADHLDVIAVMNGPMHEEPWSSTVIQNVVVLDVTQSERGLESRRLWLLVLPEEAEQLALAQHHGHLEVTVRNADDLDVVDPRVRTTPGSIGADQIFRHQHIEIVHPRGP